MVCYAFAMVGYGFISGGAKESRTPDLLHAMQALYQLSYNPEDAHKYRMNRCTCQELIRKKIIFFSKVVSKQWLVNRIIK